MAMAVANGESTVGTKTILDSDSESGYQEEHGSIATEFRTSLYKKTENISGHDSARRTAEKEFGDSDDDNSEQEGTTFEGDYDTTFYSFTTLDENEPREKSPGFDDFFRINENDLQCDGGGGHSSDVSNDCNNSDGSCIHDNGFERNSTPEEMDILFTGYSDSNARDDNVRLQRDEDNVLRNVDEVTPIDQKT
ncbi:hypothetical protein QTP88_023634 [Uroleucon formosanum]